MSQTPLLYSEGKWRKPREEAAENLVFKDENMKRRKIEEYISTRGKAAENFSQRKTRSRIYSESCSQAQLKNIP